MTPQEQQLVDELFDRLASLENSPRDPEAERLIAAGVRQSPHAVYALVQTALVQDEALKRANARIQDLEAELNGDKEPQQQQGGFLDSMREAVFGHAREAPTSVPGVRPQAPGSFARESTPPAMPPGYPPQGAAPAYPPPSYPAYGGGGSFLGTAASVAAGAIGGGLLLDGIRSMFSHPSGFGGNQSAFGGFGDTGSPWGNAGHSDLARDAGIDQIDHGGTAPSQGGYAEPVVDDNSGYDNDFGSDDGGEFDGGGTDV